MALDTFEIPGQLDAAYPPMSRVFTAYEHVRTAAAGGTYVESGGQVTPGTGGGYKVDIAPALCRVGPSASRNEYLFRFAGATAQAITVAADATNPKWVLVELEAGQIIDFTGGTAAPAPILPDITAGRVPVAALFVPPNASSVETWQGTADGKVQIHSLRIVRKMLRASDVLGARYGVVPS